MALIQVAGAGNWFLSDEEKLPVGEVPA